MISTLMGFKLFLSVVKMKSLKTEETHTLENMGTTLDYLSAHTRMFSGSSVLSCCNLRRHRTPSRVGRRPGVMLRALRLETQGLICLRLESQRDLWKIKWCFLPSVIMAVPMQTSLPCCFVSLCFNQIDTQYQHDTHTRHVCPTESRWHLKEGDYTITSCDLLTSSLMSGSISSLILPSFFSARANK